MIQSIDHQHVEAKRVALADFKLLGEVKVKIADWRRLQIIPTRCAEPCRGYEILEFTNVLNFPSPSPEGDGAVSRPVPSYVTSLLR